MSALETELFEGRKFIRADNARCLAASLEWLGPKDKARLFDLITSTDNIVDK